jgi:hypothetical protein
MSLLLAAIVATSGGFAGHQTAGTGAQIELWQVINLIGAPVLAILFLQPVIDDLRAWLKRD